MSEDIALHPDMFPSAYKTRMIHAYPVIAQMGPEEFYFSTVAEREGAFMRILFNRHLRRTHEMYLEATNDHP